MFLSFVREPARSFVYAINDWYQKKHGRPAEIDAELAVFQHRAYVKNLRTCGIEVVQLPSEERFPDGCFTQDPALVCDDEALILNVLKASRKDEGVSFLAPLANLGRKVIHMDPSKGICDGGDVMVAHDVKEVWVGISARTDMAGFEQVRAFYAHQGYTARPVTVTQCLHLITGASYLRDRTVLICDLIDARPFLAAGYRCLRVPPEERYAANVLALDRAAIAPAGFPTVAAMLAKEGYEVLTTPMSEFSKADGSVTCLSNIMR